jgi:hypothetical protein
MGAPTTANTTIEYFDGFDDYSIAQISRYWNSGIACGGSFGALPSNGTLIISPGNGRNGTASLRYTGSNTLNPLLALSSQPTRTVGFAWKGTQFNEGNNAYTESLVIFWDTSLAQVAVLVDNIGRLSVYRMGNSGNPAGGATLLLGPSSQTLTTNTYFFIEFSATIHPTAGAATLKVNGTTWLTGSALNTRTTANSSANGVSIGPGGQGGGLTWDYDDFYSRADGLFCGDVRVETRLPAGNGATDNFVPSAGTNWQNVDDNPTTDDTDYNASATAGDIDLYTYPALTTTVGSVQAVMTCPVLRNDAAGTVTAVAQYRQGSTNYNGAAQNIGSTTYNAYPDIQGFDPSTGVPWTIAGVNAAQFGVKRTT